MTLLNGHVYTSPNGVRGFDDDEKISPQAAAAFYAYGYRFCLRYVGRLKANADLTANRVRRDRPAARAMPIDDSGHGRTNGSEW